MAVVNWKVYDYLFVLEKELFVQLCLNAHGVVRLEAEALTAWYYLVYAPLSINDALVLSTEKLIEFLAEGALTS